MMDTGHMPIRDCSHETYNLRASLQAIDHIGSGGNAAVVRGFVDGEAPQELALKLLDPRCVNADDREREYRKFEHANLVRIEELCNLSDLGFAHVPDWYSNILDCDPDPFVSHPVPTCSPNPCNWRQGKSDKTLAEFGPADFFILVMEYCPIALSEHIKHSRSMREIHRILIEVCAGLTTMHKEGIIHTDLDIQNIVMTNEGVTKIVDFGLSERWKEGIKNILHNPLVAAPELRDGEGDPRSDIYSLGLLAFQLATGKDLLDAPITDNYDFSELNVPRRFVEICIEASEDSPELRFSTANDFSEALNKIW